MRLADAVGEGVVNRRGPFDVRAVDTRNVLRHGPGDFGGVPAAARPAHYPLREKSGIDSEEGLVTHRLVLVVDDDDDVREITCIALQAVGQCTVVDTDRGTKAVDLAAEHRPEVILLDVMMPEMDGIATARALWEDDRHPRHPGHPAHRQGAGAGDLA